ncbi:10151_t:CDS:1, partial [Racocetra persica]
AKLLFGSMSFSSISDHDHDNDYNNDHHYDNSHNDNHDHDNSYNDNDSSSTLSKQSCRSEVSEVWKYFKKAVWTKK